MQESQEMVTFVVYLTNWQQLAIMYTYSDRQRYDVISWSEQGEEMN